jgi:predicted Zn-dependent peptidase
VAKIGAKELYEHYLRVRKESPLEIFYVGAADLDTVLGLIAPMVEKWERSYVNLLGQTPFLPLEGQHLTETMDIAQGKLSMGFVTPILKSSPDFAALHLFNTIFGAGMTSKLFQNVREKLSLCYSVGSAIYVTKGILTVNAGIDFDKEQQTRQEILHQLALCQQGNITEEELRAAKEAIHSGLRSAMDSPGAIEGYHSTAALNGTVLSREQYMEAVEKVTIADVVAAANTVTYHSSYFLKGVDA